MEPLLEDKRDVALNAKGLGAWAGTLVGVLVGVLAGVVGLAIGVLDLNFGPLHEYSFSRAGYILEGAFGGVVAGAIAGTIGLWIGQRVTAKAGGVISGLVGGAIGAGIGALAACSFFVGAPVIEWTIECIICASVSMVFGAIVGAISGLAVDTFGMTIRSAIPMIAFTGCCSGCSLGNISNRGIYTGLLGLVLAIVIWLSVAMVSALRGHAMGAQLYHAARHGAFGAAIGGVTGAIIVGVVASIPG